MHPHKALRRLYETIPDRSTFVHGDSHPGNVMVQDGEFVFIDLMTCGCGPFTEYTRYDKMTDRGALSFFPGGQRHFPEYR